MSLYFKLRDRYCKRKTYERQIYFYLTCSILLASVGLNTNSLYAVLGAKLVAPFIGSILSISFATVSENYPSLVKRIHSLLIQITLAVSISTVYFYLSPIKETSAELYRCSSVSLFDGVLAGICGAAVSYAWIRKTRYDIITAGTAIVTSFLPPLCSCGYCIANTKWHMLTGSIALFIINTVFLFLGSLPILLFYKTSTS